MRRPQLILVVSLLAVCWLGMQIVHEFGHVLGAWYTGGAVVEVVLKPWTFSRTHVNPNPKPITVTWAGPLIGAALPLLAWLVALAFRCPGVYLLRFFAGFCLVANGAYIGGGAFYHAGDAGMIQYYGGQTWPLVMFGVATVAAGLRLWHGEGRHFGFAGAGGKVDQRAVVVCVCLLAVILAVEIAL